MRRTMNILPLLLLAASLPVLSGQSAPPSPGTAQRIQVFRAGKGVSRVREAQAARVASPQVRGQEPGPGRTRPYQAAKPGEGVPKG